MSTTPNVSKPPAKPDMDELMRQATRSTANIGWLQDYISDWNVLVHAADRLIKAQNQQHSFDQEARAQLIGTRAFGQAKLRDLNEAYDNLYVKHLALMEKINRVGDLI